jgi:phage terminase Nu1 subunit (DNA packaging protein)
MWVNLAQTARLLDIFQVLSSFELCRITATIAEIVSAFPESLQENSGVIPE